MKKIYIFGYATQTKTIIKELPKNEYRIVIIESNKKHYKKAKADGNLDVILMDITDDDKLSELLIEDDSQIVALIEDEHLNLFLILSLRDLYPNVTILAISNSLHTASKLKLAGATNVIDLHDVSSFTITNILEKPVATKLFNSFLGVNNDISFKEYQISKGSFLNTKLIEEVNFELYGLLLIGIIDFSVSDRFIFVGEGISHKINEGDIIVCIGKNKDLERFDLISNKGDGK
jgi:Trk K+ transport system NAD-binding subunit